MQQENSVTPKLYGLRKVHKDRIPLQPIVALQGSPTYKLAKGLFRHLKHLVSDSPHTVRNAEEFLSHIKDVRIEDDEVMVSFDITAQFTCIPN